MTGSYLLFLLSGKLFGARLEGALEILPWRAARKVPLAYSYVEGLIDYRGVIYPVFNLAQKLGLKPQGPIGFTAQGETTPAGQQSIILLEEKKAPFGIMVDSIVKMIKADEVAPDASKGDGFIRGLLYDDNKEIILLDFERLFFHGG